MAVAPPQSVAEVAQLVKRLYQPGNAAVIVPIQDQLQALQRSNDGWQLADALLADDDINVRFFGALTFTVKLNNDGVSLDEETAQAVLQRLISWLVRLINAKEGPLVVRKLCSTLVTYFLRAPARWGRPLFHLLCSFRQGDAVSVDDVSTASVSAEELLRGLNTRQQIALLWFSSALADEIGKMEYSGPAQAGFHVQMEKEASDTSQLIKFAMIYPAHVLPEDQSEDLSRGQVEALRCFSTWAGYAQPMWPTKPDALQHLRSLLPTAMGLLRSESCDEDAMGVFVDLLESYTSFFEPQHLDHLAQYIEDVQGPILREHLEETGGVFHQAGQFVISYSIAVIEDIVERPESKRAQVSLPLLVAIFKASGYPGDDDELSAMSIEFWNTYAEYVTDTIYSNDAEEPQPTWLPHARGVTYEVINLIWSKAWAPPSSIAKTWGDNEKEAFRTFRTDVSDLFISVYLFLGQDMLRQFVQYALQSLEQKEWRALEASMFCLNAIADNALEEQTSDELLASLFQSALFREMGNFSQSIPTQTRRTAIDMLGNYGAYLERHAEVLPDAIRFLFASLETAAFANIAAKSISAMCSTCRRSLTGELDGFLGQYQSFLRGPTSDPYTKEKVIGGIAAIVQALTPESAKARPLTALLENVEKDVAYAKEQMSGSDPEMGQLMGECSLQCLASIGRSLQVPDEVVPIDLYDDDETSSTQPDFWQSLEGKAVQQRITGCFSVLEVVGHDGDAVDAACQVLRSGFTETAPGPFVLPPSVTVSFLQQCSASTPQIEAVLNTACMLMAQHSRSGSSRIDAEARDIFNQTASFTQALGQPSTDPGVAQCSIDVFGRLFPTYASVLLDSSEQQISSVLNFTLQAIEGPDPLPKRSALDFWTKLVKASGHQNTSVTVSADIAAKALSVTTAFGPSFTLALVRQAAGLGQRSEMDSVAEPLKALFAYLPAQAKGWTEAALWSGHFPPVAQGVGDTEKRRFLMQCVGLRGIGKTKEIVKDFFVACRGLTW